MTTYVETVRKEFADPIEREDPTAPKRRNWLRLLALGGLLGTAVVGAGLALTGKLPKIGLPPLPDLAVNPIQPIEGPIGPVITPPPSTQQPSGGGNRGFG